MALFLLLVFVSNSQDVSAQDDSTSDDPPAALRIYETAKGLQDAGRFDRAAVQYARLINEHEGAVIAAIAHYELGICQFETGKYKLAVENFDSFLKHKHSSKNKAFVPFARYNLGLAAYEIARAEGAKDVESSAKRAIASFDALEKQHSKSDLLDDSIFFRAQARFLLDDLKGAAKDLQAIVDNHPASELRSSAMMDLGSTWVDLGDFSKALNTFDSFLEEFPGDTSENEVKLRRLDCRLQIQIAKDKKNTGADHQPAQQHYAELASKYQNLGRIKGFELGFHALQQQAFCLSRSGQFDDAAKVYQSVAEQFPNLPETRLARLNAARNYELAKDDKNAESMLKLVMKNDSALHSEAGWMLCKIHLKNGEFDTTYQLADSILKTAKGSRYEAPVLFIQAQAAAQLEGKLAESTRLFKQVAQQFKSEAIAAEALYNAAFNELQQRNAEAVHSLADRLKQDYSTSSFAPDMIELDGEAYLQEKDNEKAQEQFQYLVDNFEDHPLAGKWLIRLAESISFQGNYQQVINLLNEHSGDFENKTLRAHALYLVGLSQFNLEKNLDAAETLKRSFDSDSSWKFAAAVQLLRVRAALKLNDTQSASRFLERAMEDFPKSENRDEMLFRAGQIAELKNETDEAVKKYTELIGKHEKSSWVADAMYKLGWVRSRQKEYDRAIKIFTELIDQFSDHPLAKDALVARGMNHRLAGNAKDASRDLGNYLDSVETGGNRSVAIYELGLAFAAAGDNDRVIEILTPLLEEENNKFADGVHYELAWAYQSTKDSKNALKHFKQIVDNFPGSEHFAEANFHVGESHYTAKEYSEAKPYYQVCFSKSKDDALKEKACYKLAWSMYHQKDYVNAQSKFEEQVANFDRGLLIADGQFMSAECLFKQEKFDEALVGYQKAIPMLDRSRNSSTRVKRLARLHGAQSAIKSKQYNDAVKLAGEITDDPNADYYHEAYFELGDAYHKLNQNEDAKKAWAKSGLANNKTGARSNYMLGELHFGEKDFDGAIGYFEQVVFRYGGIKAPDDIKVWQALSAYEIARCYHVQIKGESDTAKRNKLITDAISSYEYVVKNFKSRDDIVAQSTKALRDLRRLQ